MRSVEPRAGRQQIRVDSVDVLRRAELPEDLLNRDNVRHSAESFLRFFDALDTVERLPATAIPQNKPSFPRKPGERAVPTLHGASKERAWPDRNISS